MKIVKRSCCFETNSSSMHSIVVTKNDVHVTKEELDYANSQEYNCESIYVGKDGFLNLTYGNVENGFGRYPFMILSTFKDKLEYAICEYCGVSWLYDSATKERFEKNIKMFEGIVKKYFDNFTGFKLPVRLCYYLKDGNGNADFDKAVDYDYRKDKFSYDIERGNKYEEIAVNEDDVVKENVPSIGIIDHQSSGMLDGFLRKHSIDIEEFLTNKKYITIVDGDEIEEFEKCIYSGLINTDNILERYR